MYFINFGHFQQKIHLQIARAHKSGQKQRQNEINPSSLKQEISYKAEDNFSTQKITEKEFGPSFEDV